jgi:hypothetical protein
MNFLSMTRTIFKIYYSANPTQLKGEVSFREFLVRNFPTGLQGGLPKQGWRQVCLCLPKQAVYRAPYVYSTRNHLIKIFDKQDVIDRD